MFTNSRKLVGIAALGACALASQAAATTAPAVCETQAPAKNSAFVFIKPHANTKASQVKVQGELKKRGIKVVREGELSGEQIDEDMLIDQHYYAIASKATLLKPNTLPVPEDKFKAAFGLEWKDALADGVVFNAIDACKYLGVDGSELDSMWSKSKLTKFGGGFYCGKIEPNIAGKHKTIYVFNGFFMSMRGKFVQPNTSIHYYVVDFQPDHLSWADFRGKPTVGDNCVHASASPFEGLAENMNWLGLKPAQTDFGKRLLDAGVSAATIKDWSVDPQVKGKSVFDQLEDLDAEDCIKKCVELSKK
eukprot:GSChrysophyteH2.ASY1.ANO1.347.1 assembled CDS